MPTAPLTPVLVRMLQGRVGSTATMRLLATSPEVAFERTYPFEHSYLSYLTLLTRQIALPRDEADATINLVYHESTQVGPLPFEASIFDPQELAHRSLVAIWAEFTHCVRRNAPEARYYAEKYWGRLSPLLDAGLKPVVIDLVRDPRDVVASIRAFNARHSQRLFGRPRARDEPEHFRQLVAGMALRLAELNEVIAIPRLQLRYEDLIEDLPGQAAKLNEFLGVELDAGAFASDQALQERHRTAPSVEASVGRWQDELSAEEIAYIERRLGRRMRALGYD